MIHPLNANMQATERTFLRAQAFEHATFDRHAGESSTSVRQRDLLRESAQDVRGPRCAV
jgi:hypothetical protein